MDTYFCLIHKQGPLRDPLDCSECADKTRDEALQGQICMTPQELPDGNHEFIEIMPSQVVPPAQQ